MIGIDINYSSSDFEQTLKWYNLAFKDKHPNKQDERAYHKINMLVESLKQDELEENEP